MRALALVLLLAASAARAQDASTEDRLRDALRHATVELRAAQDQIAPLQAQVAQLTAERDQLRATVAAQAVPAPQPAQAAAAPEEVERLQAQLRAAQSQAAGAAAAAQRLQSAGTQAAEAARETDAARARAEAGGKQAETRLAACKRENTALIGIADEILKLYKSEDFRSVLFGSYEPVLGYERVKLENIVQGYEDKIDDHRYDDRLVKPAQPAPAQPAR